MKAVLAFLRRLWKAKTFSPEGFLLRALLIAVVFAASELLGLREYTTFLSGTSGDVSLSWRTASLLGLIHLLLYVAFILLVPILLIAAGLLAASNRWIASAAGPAQTHACVAADVRACCPRRHEG